MLPFSICIIPSNENKTVILISSVSFDLRNRVVLAEISSRRVLARATLFAYGQHGRDRLMKFVRFINLLGTS